MKTPTTTTYRILKNTGFYSYLNTLLIAIIGVGVAIELKLNGSISHNPGDFITIEAKHLGYEVRLPIVGPVEAALANQKADEIHVTVVHGKTSSQLTYGSDGNGFIEFTDAIFLPFLVTYHEKYRPQIQSKYPQGRTSWPDAWQMSWALRNAASHGGKVFEKLTQQPVSWRGIHFSPSDEPSQCILSLVNGGDMLLLMIEMEELRTDQPLTKLENTSIILPTSTWC